MLMDHKLNNFKFTTTELSAEKANSALSELVYASPSDVISKYFDWLIDSKKFRFALVVPSRQTKLLPSFRERHPFPSICASAEQLAAHRTLLTDIAQRGFEFITSVSGEKQDHFDFFEQFQFEIIDEKANDGKETPLLSAAWNKTNLAITLDVALHLGGDVFCCFAHDADPIFVISDFAGWDRVEG